jgi:hypothetical protein
VDSTSRRPLPTRVKATARASAHVTGRGERDGSAEASAWSLANKVLQLSIAAGRPLRGLALALAAEHRYVGQTGAQSCVSSPLRGFGRRVILWRLARSNASRYYS